MGVWTAKAGGGNVTIDEHCHVTVIDPSNPATHGSSTVKETL